MRSTFDRNISRYWGVCAGCTLADFVGDHTAGAADGATMSFADTHFLGNRLAPLYNADDDSHLSVVIADVGFSGVGNTAVRQFRTAKHQDFAYLNVFAALLFEVF